MRRLIAAALLAGALAAPAAASTYPWPVRPFDRQHPIRGFFGDPRTVFQRLASADGIDGPGMFSFHQGVDIVARDGTPVYAVADGRAHYVGANTVEVLAPRHVVFQYFHLVPVVGERQHVLARRTVLGYVQAPFGHVHLTEIDRGRAVNPLRRGHLVPYRDRTRPQIAAVEIENSGGPLDAGAPVCGRVQLAAAAFDVPPLPVPGPFRGLPVVPAYVAWSIRTADGRAVRRGTAVDFRRRLPPHRLFWHVYARGTYENAPRFGTLQYKGTPGRYLFKLATSFDTATLHNGSYVLVVRAADVRGGAATARVPFVVANTSSCPASLPADPPPGVPPTPAPVLGAGVAPGGPEEP
jgi:murein DD-endopeptidase MepM/ murein hydrolase activator NlpD